MKKLLLAFIFSGSLSYSQCNQTSFNPITVCAPNQTKVIASSVQTDIIYLCGVNSVVWDTFNPPSIKYRNVFVNAGAVYNIKSTAGNHQVNIYAKTGSTVNIMAGTNLAFSTAYFKESGATLNNAASSGSLTNTTCSVITGPTNVNCTLTAIQEQSIASETSIWPNPSYGKLYIHAKTEDKAQISVSIFNQLDEVVLNEEFINNGKKELSLEKYPTGIYFVRIRSGNLTETKKIVLVK
jgi:hypothetical protein